MNRMKRVWVVAFSILLAVELGCAMAWAASPKVERIGPVAEASDTVKQALAQQGYRVTLDDGWTAEFWLAKPLKTAKKDAAGALFPELTNGQFVGLVRFRQGFSDYRGQAVAAGIYTLRYQLLPQDGNHMGVTPNPDFLLLSPVADDSRPEITYLYRKLTALSSKATTTGHPAVMAMESAGDPGAAVKQYDGGIVLTVSSQAADGSAEALGLIIKGAAAQ
jgi:hypothetical protein